MTEGPTTRSVRLAPWLAAVIAILLMLILGTLVSPGGLGIDGQTSTKVERDRNWKVVKYSIESKDGKTVWDWLGLIGVPMTLAVLGIWFQSQEQERASRDAEEQRRLAAEESKEETLQRYLDRVSQLLIEKDLIRQSSVVNNPIIESASDVIRARTLSVFRSFSQDGERKGSVVFFLIETEVLHKLKVSLAESHLSSANLSSANLSGADLSRAVLRRAYLRGANLSRADLSRADLFRADLDGADLKEADLRGADLRGASLCGANLSGGDHSLFNLGADLRGAKLSRADLSRADLFRANLDGADLKEANLSGADLNGAHLIGANLSGANLSSANLSGADLSRANLSSANLSGADLSRAVLRRAVLRRAYLRGAKFKDTICPDGKKTDTGCSTSPAH